MTNSPLAGFYCYYELCGKRCSGREREKKEKVLKKKLKYEVGREA
jgi:predicted kinase